MLHGLIGSFTAMAFNGAQMLVVLVTVFFGVIFTLMDPRPIIRSIFLIVPERHHDQTLIIMQRIGKFVPGGQGLR
jgi:predicted PurR-regulated permease PerM